MADSINNQPTSSNGSSKIPLKQGQNFFTDEERWAAQETFCREYARTGVILASCRAVPITFGTYQYWLEHEPGFAEAVQHALEEHREAIYQEVDRRGRVGILKPLVRNGQAVEYKGQLVTVRDYSDRLLLAQLQRFFPVEKQVGLSFSTGDGAGDTYVHLPWDAMTTEEQAIIETIGRNIDSRMQKGGTNGNGV